MPQGAITVQLESFLTSKALSAKTNDGVVPGIVRDRKGRLILADETAVDLEKLRQAQIPLLDVGRRVRLFAGDMSREIAAYLLPVELGRISKEDAAAADGLETPLGVLVADHGLWLKHKPGIEEIGTNDRGEVLLRLDPARAADPTVGPVRGAATTIIAGRCKNLVTRLDLASHEADKREARAWMRALEIVEGKATQTSTFVCAGISYEVRGNATYLIRTSRLNFFDPEDPDTRVLSAEIAKRFERAGKKLPNVQIFSMIGMPTSEAAHAAFLGRLTEKGASPSEIGIPTDLTKSQFYDPATKGITSSNLLYFAPLKSLPSTITIVTCNTDYHGEVKSRGVLSPLMAIMSQVDVISAHAGCAVLNGRGTVTTFTGPTGTGKTTAGSFWAERNERYRRNELKRRYAIDLKSEEKAAETLERTGILCQEDWVEIVKRDDGSWVFWPTERTMYARTGGFPGLRYILAENLPTVENVCADFGASGRAADLGRVTHDYFPERIFYDPAWGHLKYDRNPRVISANVFLERNRELDFFVKRVEGKEAIQWLLLGRTPAGKFEPLYNAYPDFSGLLMTYGVVGNKLIEAVAAAEKGEFGPIGNGDKTIGEAIYDKLSVQLKLWREHTRDVPMFIVNGAPGLEITQDANWLLSEHPDCFQNWQKVTVDDFKSFMKERYGVTYGQKGEWTHIRPEDRR